MKIVILGAGAVGRTLASLLSQENDLVVVDRDSSELHRLEEEADIKTITGEVSYPNILVNAGIHEADMIVAVTGSDETNIVSCLIAKSTYCIDDTTSNLCSKEIIGLRL